jgi:predicted secreted protein
MYKGKSSLVQVGTDNTTWNTVAEMNDFSLSFKGNNIDSTVFADTYVGRVQGLKDTSYKFSGFWKYNDATGQVVIQNAFLNDTALYVKILPDGTNGWKQQVRVSNFEISAAVDGGVEVSFDLEGTGAVTAQP